MNYKSYHFQLGRVIYGVKSAIYNIANYTGVSVINFTQSGILLVDYYFTIQGSDESIEAFEQNLKKSFERLKDD